MANLSHITLCSCALAQCNSQQMSEVTHAHDCALERLDERLDTYWQVFAAPSCLGALRAGDLIEN
jgi:hypothetical protein